MDWGKVWAFIKKVLEENPELLTQIIQAIIRALSKDPQAATQLLHGLILKK